MSKLERIKDPETLQQVASHLEKTVIRQQQIIAKQRIEISRLRGQDLDPQMELEALREQLAAMQHRLYGSSSEKRSTEKTKTTEREAQTGHGPREQPDLPVQIELIELPEDERECAVCGGEIEEMKGQVESTQTITVVEIDYTIVEHQRQKYRCRCNANVVTAPAPEIKLQPGGRYSIDFAVHVAEKKYLDHMPLERQVRAMGRRGLRIDSQTLWDQLDAAAKLAEPTWRALHEKVRQSLVAYADETRWPLLGKKGSSPSWAWCLASRDAVVYRVDRRSKKAAEELIGDFSGVLVTDGYTAYQSLSREGPAYTLAHCWAHVRRKFIEAEDAYPDLAPAMVERIGGLYEIEKGLPHLEAELGPEELRQSLEVRRQRRDAASRPIVQEILDEAVRIRGAIPPRSKMGKAIAYMLTLWPGLTVFLDDPRVPIDNNAAERALRGVVVGRKNHYGSRSTRGTEVAAIFYSLFETAKLAAVDPKVYVAEVLTRARRDPAAVTLPADLLT